MKTDKEKTMHDIPEKLKISAARGSSIRKDNERMTPRCKSSVGGSSFIAVFEMGAFITGYITVSTLCSSWFLVFFVT